SSTQWSGRGPKGGCARCGSRKSAWAAAVDTDHISQRLLRCFGAGAVAHSLHAGPTSAAAVRHPALPNSLARRRRDSESAAFRTVDVDQCLFVGALDRADQGRFNIATRCRSSTGLSSPQFSELLAAGGSLNEEPPPSRRPPASV